MKKYFLQGILYFIIISMNSCNKIYHINRTEASFSMNKTTAKAGETIIFTNLSKNAENFKWLFGDGALSYEKDPSHSYSSAGTFTVELYVNAKGKSIPPVAQVSKTILITPQDIK
jgi:PKD repeat protein